MDTSDAIEIGSLFKPVRTAMAVALVAGFVFVPTQTTNVLMHVGSEAAAKTMNVFSSLTHQSCAVESDGLFERPSLVCAPVENPEK